MGRIHVMQSLGRSDNDHMLEAVDNNFATGGRWFELWEAVFFVKNQGGKAANMGASLWTLQCLGAVCTGSFLFIIVV